MRSWVSITRYIPKRATPNAQYRFRRKGELVNMVTIPRHKTAAESTRMMPQLVVKSVCVVNA